MILKSTFVLVGLLTLAATEARGAELATAAINRTELDRVIAKAQDNCWYELKDNNWNFPTYLGTWFLSEYYFELKALGITNSQFNETFFT